MRVSKRSVKPPLLFDDFFQLGLPDDQNPFLTAQSRKWGLNLPLKISFLSAGLLLLAFILTFFESFIPLSYLLLCLVYFFAGIPSLIDSIVDITNLEINIDIMMVLAAFSSVLIGSGFEGGLLLVLFDISGSMEDSVNKKAKGAISNLHKLAPSMAYVINEDGFIYERSIKDIEVGTLILIKAGEVVPLDGIVVDGISSVNLVHLTGESVPILKKVGDEVPAGSRNQEGALTLKVTRTSSDSTLARIIQLVTQAQEARPQLQRWFDKFSTRYASIIILTALTFAVLMPWILNVPYLGVEGSIYRALAFLIAASPCALILAIPIAYLSAVSVCARQGILLKGGVILDALASCRAIAFDKTGTLTLGELTCIGFEALEENSETDLNEALAVASALEKNAVHPIAKAITNLADEKKVATVPLKEFKSVAGYGLTAKVSTTEIQAFIGNPDYIVPQLSEDIAQKLLKEVTAVQERGELLTIMLINNQVYIFRFLDIIRPKISETIQELKKQNWELLMLTGDHKSNAKRTAQELGIDNFFADLRPEDKLQIVSKIAQEKGLIMVGDGINDAPALARATVGICMGKVGSATAVEAADVVLLHDNLELIGWLMDKARKTQKIVKQNLFLAAGVILFTILPALSGLVPLWLAVLLHEGGTVLVGLNALRLLKR